MTVYVSLPQVPLTLKFEEAHDEVVTHFQDLIESGSVHRYEFDEGQSVIVNFGVIAAVSVNDGHRVLEVSELHRGLRATIPAAGGPTSEDGVEA